MKVLVVFGSVSDKAVSAPLVEALKRVCDDVEFQVISAHRDLEKLQAKISTFDGDAVVAGAGLAAALPGVVAAMTKVPVFGMPVASQFGGLDSLCSIAQMPPGVPVLTCGPDKVEVISGFLQRWKEAKNSGRVHCVAPAGVALAEIEKAKQVGADIGVEVTSGTEEDKDALNVYFVQKAEDVRPEGFGLHVPLFGAEDVARPETYLNVLGWTGKGGLWLGANNAKNAVHAASRLKRSVA